MYRLKLAVGGYIALTYSELCSTLGFAKDSEFASVIVTNRNTITYWTMRNSADVVKLYDEVVKHGFVPSVALTKSAENYKAAGIGQKEV